jgi:cell pole-organizing protein PopZ
MEEILASIRLIISDDAKRAPLDRQDVRAPQPAALRKDAVAPPQEEEVLDLTEELVFPEEQPAPPTSAKPAATLATPPVAERPAETEPEPTVAEEAPHAEEHATEPTPPEPAIEVETRQEPVAQTDYAPRHETAAPEPRPEPAFRPAPPPSRPIWSRREFPGSPAPAASARPRTPPEPSTARPAQRSWADDIQMPIPDRGPVSLIAPGETQAQIKAPIEEPSRAVADLQEMNASEALGEKEEAAVAALAESLARSAASAMDEEELATARDVNFEHLHEERKAEVAESFAKAIERESAPRERSPFPTLFDEVFRQDLAHEPEAEAPAPEREEVETAAAAFVHEDRATFEREFEEPARAEAVQAERADDKWPFFSAPPAPSAPPQAAEPSRHERHVAQAQFLGTSQTPAPAAPVAPAPEAGQTLEGAVREMLRPMLKQWLNDNMPRILESAIREEIATRGHLSKVDS